MLVAPLLQKLAGDLGGLEFWAGCLPNPVYFLLYFTLSNFWIYLIRVPERTSELCLL